jgi:CubicO group peptidase (beta-lactamase class C family)
VKASSSLDAELRDLVATHVPGVAVVIVGAEGVRATDVAVPWFSMTKLVTATTVMGLAARGVLPLDTPLLPLVPAMSSLRPLSWAQRITARHLLQHSGGLANPIPLRWVHPASSPGPDPLLFLGTQLAQHPKLDSEPGTRASYSNLGALLLAAAITNATGASFEEVVRQEVLHPAGMTQTDFCYPAVGAVATGNHPRYSPMRLLLPRWVIGQPHGRWLTLRPFLVDGAAYGGLVGSAEDAARFLQMHLSGGRIDGHQVISAADAAAMCQINQPGKRYDLGLGWFTPTKNRGAQPAFVEHLGGGAGFFNVIRLYPSAGVGVVVMGNATRYDIDAIARLAMVSFR